ncbi:MAG: chemotaxis response regulator protein-glutamate methylesterase [Cellvibrionaceae bacterium]|nr:chemotaxis response regulator protein-glutamate methylesterase [Cellvibrionaceae bacterium]|tara:strand:- start:38507 stop:39565 length:1059 start_codon:yes stop_codon:yes gene_type:complete
MPLKVLVVDDSNFFQQRLREMLDEHPELTVVGVASNGREAVEKAKSLRPDVITMDYEMPVMDGVTAVRQIMADRPTPILMFSSLTYEGARTTLDALDAGAVDFLPKNFSEISNSSASLKAKLHSRLLAIARPRTVAKTEAPRSGVGLRSPVGRDSGSSPVKPVSLKGKVRVLVIGASTGGPVALMDVLIKLPKNFPIPIVLVQHMPENFTKPFAERLDRQCNLSIKEAEDGDSLRPGTALLAPGGKQLLLDKRGGVKVMPGDDRVNYKPSVDITFGSAANIYNNQAMGVVLTGMGSDGCDGARLIKQAGGAIWSQDQESCVIYGMPMAVARAKLTDRVLPLGEIGSALAKEL